MLMNRKSCACSNIKIAFRTTIPIKLITPKTHVKLKSIWNAHKPSAAPNKVSSNEDRAANAKPIFLKLTNRKKKQ